MSVQDQGGEPAAEAITAREREFVTSLIVDWDQDGSFAHPLADLAPYLTSWKTDRTLKGAAPSEIMLIEGAAAAELTLEIAGEYHGLSLDQIFSPYNGKSPLYMTDMVNSEIRLACGVVGSDGEIVWYPQFIGNVRTITPDRGERSVSITALDRAEKLRKPIRMAPWAKSREHNAQGYVYGQMVHTQWVIDNALRQCDISPTPNRPITREELGVSYTGFSGMQLWITGMAGYVPTIGWLDNPNMSTFTFKSDIGGEPVYTWGAQPHPQYPADAPHSPIVLAGGAQGTLKKYWAIDRDLIWTPATHYMGLTLVADAYLQIARSKTGTFDLFSVNIGNRRSMHICTGNGQIWTERRYAPNVGSGGYPATFTSIKFPLPTQGSEPTEVFVGWDTTVESGTQVYLRVGDRIDGPRKLADPWNNIFDLDPLKGLCTLQHAASMYDIFYSAYSAYNALGRDRENRAVRNATYGAFLDLGTNRLSTLPGGTDEAWSVVTDAAASEMGAVFWDEVGVFQFWNQQRIQNLRATNVRTLTLDEVSGLEITHNFDSVRNHITVTAPSTSTGYGVIWESKSPDDFYVPPGHTQYYSLTTSGSAPQAIYPYFLDEYWSQQWEFPGYPLSEWQVWNDDVQHGFIVQYLDAGAWVEKHWTGLPAENAGKAALLNCYYSTAGELMLKITNYTSNTMRFARAGQSGGDSQPALRIAGTMIDTGDKVVHEYRDRESIELRGDRAWNLSGDYFQEYYTDANVETAAILLDQIATPIPTTDAITIVGDPRLQLGDCLTITDPDGVGETARLQILGITRSYDSGGLSDKIAVEMIRPAGVGIWDSDQYGRWDETFVWS